MKHSPASILKIIVFVLLAVAPVAAQNPPSLQWEVVNPFRFIHDQESIEELRTAYASLPGPDSARTALALERELQRRADIVVDSQRAAARAKFDCDHPKNKTEKLQCFAPYLGWFARLALNEHKKTCWDSNEHQFRKTGPCADYLYPKSHRVRVWVTNDEAFTAEPPKWVLVPALEFTPCVSKNGKRFCIEFELPYHLDQSDAVQVAAQFPGQTLTLAPIKVQDKLIVGLGDSYAAGEGNPDLPAQFAQGKDEHDILANVLLGKHLAITRSPQSDDDTRTMWLDRRCHRSMYSYQFKTALQLALMNPQQAITYVTFSCAGATTPQIVSQKEKPNEGEGDLPPQLAALHEVLQNKNGPVRPIDYLLLSTGGNDIGFADLVAFVVLPKHALGSLEKKGVSEALIIKHNLEHSFKGTLLTDNDCGNYRQLQKALLGGSRCPGQPQVAGIPIRDCREGQPCARILLTPYPDVFQKENGEMCDGARQEFDRPFMLDPTRAHRIKVISENVFGQISAVQQDDLIAKELGWTLIDGNLKAYGQHGFCAQNLGSPSPVAETFLMPNRVNHRWDSFDPWEYRAYQVRQRWMRLPVDAKLSTNMVHFFLKLKVDLLLEDDRSNIMHPTAEGLARTADLNVETIRKMEGQSW